jgi:hypothetical protein
MLSAMLGARRGAAVCQLLRCSVRFASTGGGQGGGRGAPPPAMSKEDISKVSG